MFSEADAFLDAIFDAPSDDTPRLVYADWLEEHGQGNYARFIRLQCEAARHPLWSPEANRLWEEIGRVWGPLARDWRHLLISCPRLDPVHFHRGFPISAVGEDNSEEAAEFAYRSWLWFPDNVATRLGCNLWDFENEYGQDVVSDFFEQGRFDRLREISLAGGPIPNEFLARPFPRLRILDLGFTRIGRRSAEVLVRTSGLPCLRRL